VARLGIDRTVLDAPWDEPIVCIAHVWPDDRCADGWMRVPWPIEPRTGRFVAPIDIHLGHVLELDTAVRTRPLDCWVGDVDNRRIVLLPAQDRLTATIAGARAVELYRQSELAAVANEWSSRLNRIR
jgi:hypothetical protein